MKFKYIGRHAETETFGYRFKANLATEVDVRTGKVLSGNPLFEEVKRGNKTSVNRADTKDTE